MKVHAPMFFGSSCTQTTSRRAGKPSASARQLGAGKG